LHETLCEGSARPGRSLSTCPTAAVKAHLTPNLLSALRDLPLWLAALHAIRNQRILTAWNTRQAENQRRAAAGLPPRTRKRRRKTTLTGLTATP